MFKNKKQRVDPTGMKGSPQENHWFDENVNDRKEKRANETQASARAGITRRIISI